MLNVPSKWVLTRLGDFCDLINGRAFKPSDWSDVGLPIIRIQNLRRPDAPYNRFAGTWDRRHQVVGGDLLFAWSGTPGTSFRAYIWRGEEAILNQHIFKVVFNAEVANAEFLRVAINAYLPALMKQAKGGAGLKHLTRSAVEGIPVLLPPRQEQDRIVAALAETAGRLAIVQEELAALSKQIPTIERQVLIAATTGELLRCKTTGIASAPHSEVPGTIPIQDVGEVQVGRKRTVDLHSGPSMRPYLRVANVLDDHLDIRDMMSMNFDNAEFERYRLLPGDILINEGQSLELLGRAAMFRGDPPEVCFTNTLIRFRAGPLVDPEYALLVFRAYQHTGRFREIARITTNLAHLSLQRFAEFEFPLRSLAEQRDIVRVARSLIEKIRGSNEALLLLRSEAQHLTSAFEMSALSGGLSRQSEMDTAPIIARSGKLDRFIGKREGRSVAKAKRANIMGTVTLVDALARSEKALNGQELFYAAGYPEDATIIQVEQFFLELRGILAEGKIQRTIGDDERFVIAEPIR